jgi:hypothetical protein
MHGYAYSNNNPTTWSDPDGLRPDGALPGSTDAHDTAVHLRWIDLMVKYGPDAQITISPRTQRGADIVCWNCAKIDTNGAVDEVWVWEVKTENQGRRAAEDSLAGGITWARGHPEADSRDVVAGPMFDHESAGPNVGNPKQTVTVRSVDEGVELYRVTEDECKQNNQVVCRTGADLSAAKRRAKKHRELDDKDLFWSVRLTELLLLAVLIGVWAGISKGGGKGPGQSPRSTPRSQPRYEPKPRPRWAPSPGTIRSGLAAGGALGGVPAFF